MNINGHACIVKKMLIANAINKADDYLVAIVRRHLTTTVTFDLTRTKTDFTWMRDKFIAYDAYVFKVSIFCIIIDWR